MGTTDAEFDVLVIEIDEAVAISSISEIKKICWNVLRSNNEYVGILI